jgi:hypothetical protein
MEEGGARRPHATVHTRQARSPLPSGPSWSPRSALDLRVSILVSLWVKSGPRYSVYVESLIKIYEESESNSVL